MIKNSIIVPAYNTQDTLGACLQSVLAQAQPSQDYEIIVVNDGSTDSPSVVPLPDGVHMLNQEHGGAAAARNAGLQRAKGDIVIFLDADCVPESGWLVAMLAPFADPAVMGVSGRIDTRQTGVLPRFIQYEYDQRFRRLQAQRNIDFITSATGAYRRDVLVGMGGFRTDFLGAEDVELSFRLSKLGYILRYAPNAVVYHTHPTSLLSYARRKRHYAFWRMEVYRCFKDKIITDSRTPQTQKLQLLTLLFTALFLIAAVFWPWLFWLSGVFALAYVMTILPIVRYMLRRDIWVGLLSPLFLTVSTVAAAIGVCTAILRRIICHSPS